MIESAGMAAAGVLATVLVWAGARALYRRLEYLWLNPVLVTITVLIAGLVVFEVDYAAYERGGALIEFFLEPAVVALGVPIYLQLDRILAQRKTFFASIVTGSAVGVLSGTLVAALLGGSAALVRSLAPRSVTTPIALGIAEEIGGVPSLAAALVIASGVLGAVIGPAVLRRAGVRSRTAVGLAIGAAAHGIGTARAVEEGEVEGASSGLAIGLMGVATAVLAPPLVALVVWLLDL